MGIETRPFTVTGRNRLARLSAFLLITTYFGTAMAMPGRAGPCSATSISVQRVSASVMYVDTGISPQLRGSYVGYKITNSGAPITDVWVDVINFTGGVVNKAQYEDGRNHVGAMSTGASAFAYFYLAAAGSTATPQRHDVAVYSGHPGLGGVQVCSTNFTIQTVDETIKASANKVSTVVAGPNPGELGGLMTMTVTGDTGQVGAGPPGHPNGLGVFLGTPATEPGWRADAYQLVDVRFTFSTSGTFNDVLYVAGIDGKSQSYTAIYTFAAVGTTLAPTSVTPVNYIASGTQIKHTDTTGYAASLDPILPSENKLLVGKSASPTQLPATGGTVIYTVTITNTGTVAGVLDDVVDTLPAGAAYVPGSARFNGSVVPDPYITGQTLSFVGFFGAAPGGTSRLTYSATLPGVPGTYVNSATGHVGVEPIDTTFDTTNLSPATATVQVGVLEAPPVANDDSANTSEDIAKIIDVLANDSDPNGNIDPTKVTVTVDPSKGTATPNLDGTITYTPALNTNGADSFTYRVCDTTSPTPLCDTATVTVNVAAVDDPPTAVDDTVDTDKNTDATWNLVVNDTDPENNLDPTSLDVLSGPTKGNLINNGNGTVTYTPNTGYSGPDSFVYEICDSTGLCDTATVSITVNSVNEPPVANADAISTAEDVAVTIDVAANDTDPDGNLDPTSVRIPAGKEPSNGTAVVNADGTITYTPAANYFGTDTFEYEICDTGDPVLCSTTSAIVTTTVVQVDDPPAAVDENQTVSEDAPKTWTLSATDPDGNLSWATLSVIDGPDNGTLTLNGSGSVTYAPAQDYNGPDSFTYQVCDTTGLCDTATVSISVGAVPDPPVANGDSVKTNEGTQATWNVAANDTDPDGDLNLDSITIVTAPTNGTVDSIGTGTITYTPTGTGTDILVYEICDTTATCVTATVDITINNLPDPPVASNEVVGTNEDTPKTWTLAATDPDGNLDWATLAILSGPSNGTLDLNGNGSVTYAPAQDYNGSDSLTYEVCDDTGLCDSATASLTVNPQPDAPVARNDSASTGEDNAVIIDVIANDTDPDGDLVAGSITAPATTANGGTITNHLDGTLTYTPAANFNGTDTFTYEVCDSTPTCVTATVSVSVAAVNDKPTPQDDAFTIDEDDPATLLDLAFNDTDPDGNGDIDLTSLRILSGPGNGTVTNHLNGTVTYTPAANFNGTDTLVYQICDAAGECASATATIVVGPVADPPVAKDDAVTTPEDTAVAVNVAANDSDLDGDLDPDTVAIVTGPAKGTAVSNGNGTITYTPAAEDSGVYSIVYRICDETTGTPLCDTATLTVTVTAVDDAPVADDDTLMVDEDGTETIDVTLNDSDVDGDLDKTSVTITSPASNGVATPNGDGTVTYTPDAEYSGSDSFSYQVCDATDLCDTASVAVTVTGTPDAPVTEDDEATVAEDGTVTVDVAFNDTDPDGNLVPGSVSILSGPAHGVADANGDGTITYTPAANWFGTDTITYQICDSTAPTPICSQGTLTVEVTAVPDLPVANDDTALTAEDTPVLIDVVANDTDVDGDLDPTSVTISTAPTFGTVTVNTASGLITYYPAGEWSGTDVFAYQICDLGGNCENASITVVVYAVNDAPVVVDDAASVAEDGSVLIPVTANDSDIDSLLDLGSVTITVAPAHGTAIVNPVTGVVVYTPDPDFYGSDGFTYRVCDTGGVCSSGVVAVTVDPVNDAPNRLDSEIVKIWMQGTPGPVLFSDPEADVFTVRLISGNLPPGLVLMPDGSFQGRAEADGTYRATVEVCDIHGACSQSLLVVEVGAAALALLPFTGLALGGIGLIGMLLLLMGTVLRKLGDEEEHPEAQVRL